LAILLVLVYHGLALPEEGGNALEQALAVARSFCWAGVDLFFVLSGFLITGILLETRDRPRYFRNFYARRTLRIFPLYYGVLFAAFVAVPLVAWLLGLELLRGHQRALDRQLWLWTYTHNYLQAEGARVLPAFGPFWSLAIEEHFYLLWPVVVAALRGRRLLYLTGAVCVAALGVRLWELGRGADAWALTRMTHTRVDSLLFGALAAELVHAGVRIPRRALLATLAGCAAVVACMTAALGDFSIRWPAVATYGFTVVALLFAAGMLMLAQGELGPRWRDVLESRFCRFFGKYSYGLYVFHWPLAFWLGVKLPETALGQALAPTVVGVPLLCLLGTIGSALLLALLSWRFWESRWLRCKARFA
jgi:peptidoglycan/LPS O-acetylase OafA/YrhL